MNEFVVVEFAEDRAVLVDGQLCGRTNELLVVEGGQHTISLDGPANVKPPEWDGVVENTDALKPLEVCFEKI